MRFFLDSSVPADIRRAHETGFLAGVTTNPHLLAQSSDLSFADLTAMAKVVEGPFNLQVLSEKADEMVAQGKYFASLADNIVVKVPLTTEGLKACRLLSEQDIPVNVTLCFSVAQALLAAQAGAAYISPFIGRLEASGGDGLQLIEDIRIAYDMGGMNTEILAASIRQREHAEGAALRGADIATCPAAVFFALHAHPMTDQGLETIVPHYPELRATCLP
ncbi:fructose-6-phosphate aldolase [bacterium NHP-B]|nr:fructose-6-phosphate aldolase [bacterium NHP-B]